MTVVPLILDAVSLVNNCELSHVARTLISMLLLLNPYFDLQIVTEIKVASISRVGMWEMNCVISGIEYVGELFFRQLAGLGDVNVLRVAPCVKLSPAA